MFHKARGRRLAIMDTDSRLFVIIASRVPAPPWLPPIPDPNPAWLDGYYLGLACALAVGGAGVRESAFLDEALGRAARVLGASPETAS